jgi:flagellar basal-body rod protein FlgB
LFRNLLENPSAQRMERALDAAALRAKLLSHNISNVNTPGYKRVDLDFAGVLAETQSQQTLALRRTHPQHLSVTPDEVGELRIVRENGTSSREDRNNVDIEYEMTKVTENSLYFQSVSGVFKQQMSRIKMAIEGR